MPFWMYFIGRALLWLGIMATAPIWVPLVMFLLLVSCIAESTADFAKDVRRDYLKRYGR